MLLSSLCSSSTGALECQTQNRNNEKPLIWLHVLSNNLGLYVPQAAVDDLGHWSCELASRDQSPRKNGHIHGPVAVSLVSSLGVRRSGAVIGAAAVAAAVAVVVAGAADVAGPFAAAKNEPGAGAPGKAPKMPTFEGGAAD